MLKRKNPRGKFSDIALYLNKICLTWVTIIMMCNIFQWNSTLMWLFIQYVTWITVVLSSTVTKTPREGMVISSNSDLSTNRDVQMHCTLTILSKVKGKMLTICCTLTYAKYWQATEINSSHRACLLYPTICSVFS